MIEHLKKYFLADEETGEALSKNLILYIFNMDRIKDIWYSKDEKLIEKYKYLIMLDLNKEELENLALKDKKVGKYNMELKSVNVSVGINDWISEEKDKEMWKNTYIEEGKEQGIEQGAKQKQREMIINLNNLDTPIEVIAKASNLSIEEVEKIIEENK